MAESQPLQPTVVYVVVNHPLDLPGRRRAFNWLKSTKHMPDPLEAWLGPYQPDTVTWIRDPRPGGPGWNRLIGGLESGQISRLVTHLAQLSGVQQQWLIALCAQAGAQLITPGDAGRNMAEGDRRTGP